MLSQRTLSKIFSFFNILILILALIFSGYLGVVYFSDEFQLGSVAIEGGYLGIFVFTTLLELSIQFIGPDVLLAAGMLAKLNLFYIIIMLTLGSWLGGLVGYYMGLTSGDLLVSIFISKKRFRKGLDVFKKYGNIGMAILALTPLPYFPIIAGIFKMKFKNFLIYALLARTLRWIGLAYIINLIV